MAISPRGRSVMALFSSSTSIHSHRVRFVLAEKGINVEVVDVDPTNPPEDLIDLNPYQSIPTLLDRDLVLYDAGVVTEYLDERYPHPPLMPVDPVSRARLRLAKFRLMRDWYPLVNEFESDDQARRSAAAKRMSDDLVASNDVFKAGRYFLHDELTLVDCALAPFLWRLEHWGVAFPEQADGLIAYTQRVFELSSFKNSLSEPELDMRL